MINDVSVWYIESLSNPLSHIPSRSAIHCPIFYLIPMVNLTLYWHLHRHQSSEFTTYEKIRNELGSQEDKV
jgi:hypothetical protein